MDYANSSFEIKQLDDSGAIEGLLAGFNNLDSHRDRIAPSAFTRTLAERKGRPLPMLLHHDPTRPIGVWNDWQEIPAGLYVKGAMTLAARDAQEAYALAKAGALSALSIGYVPKQFKREAGERHLLDVELFEGSLLTFGSNPKAMVTAVKSIANARDIAEMLQEAGFSGRRAKAAAGAAWKALNDTDDHDTELAAIAALFDDHAARLAAR